MERQSGAALRLGLGRVAMRRDGVERISRQAVVAPPLGAGEVDGAPALVEAPRLVPLQHVEVQPAAAARRRLLPTFTRTLHNLMCCTQGKRAQ